MNFKYKSQLILIFVMMCSIAIFSQESIVSVGGDISSSDGSVSFTIGQSFYNTNSNSELTIAEGVQQPFEISLLSLNDYELNSVLKVYPIPTSDFLVLKISDLNTTDLTYEIIDLQGKVIINGNIDAIETTIDLTSLEQSIYILNINRNSKIQHTAKIIKF